MVAALLSERSYASATTGLACSSRRCRDEALSVDPADWFLLSFARYVTCSQRFAMPFTRFQIALLGVAIGLAALALGRVMALELNTLKAVVLDEQGDEPAPLERSPL